MKNCLYCGKEIERKEYESPRDFDRRIYCDKTCFNNHRLQKRKEKLTGKRFGKLTITDVFEENGEYFVLVLCDCGNEKKYKYSGFKVAKPTHCGCTNKNITHGMSKTSLYSSWNGMKNRCNLPKGHHRKYYYDKGIRYCDDWGVFENFKNWALSNGYVDGYTLERIDNSKGYCPENCRWATRKQQSNNLSTCVYFKFMGERLNITQFCEKYKVSTSNFYKKARNNICIKKLMDCIATSKSRITDEEWQRLCEGYKAITGEEYKI